MILLLAVIVETPIPKANNLNTLKGSMGSLIDVAELVVAMRLTKDERSEIPCHLMVAG